MSNRIPEQDQIEIVCQVKQLKGKFQIGYETPVGNDLPMLLRQSNIILLEYPVPRAGSGSFSAIFWRTQVEERPICFVGVNTCDYYDRQLFAIAHELYHFINNGVPHISRDCPDRSPEEQRADWFAAEFLLPLQVVKEQVQSAFGRQDVSNVPLSALLRFIAQLQCTWWIPYQSIVHRLTEAGAINEAMFHRLFAIDARDNQEQYYRIGMAISPEVFKLLNTVTERTGTDGANLEICLRNYEDGIISEDELCDGLDLFHVSPEDFGISFLPEAGGAEDED